MQRAGFELNGAVGRHLDRHLLTHRHDPIGVGHGQVHLGRVGHIGLDAEDRVSLGGAVVDFEIDGAIAARLGGP